MVKPRVQTPKKCVQHRPVDSQPLGRNGNRDYFNPKHTPTGKSRLTMTPRSILKNSTPRCHPEELMHAAPVSLDAMIASGNQEHQRSERRLQGGSRAGTHPSATTLPQARRSEVQAGCQRVGARVPSSDPPQMPQPEARRISRDTEMNTDSKMDVCSIELKKMKKELMESERANRELRSKLMDERARAMRKVEMERERRKGAEERVESERERRKGAEKAAEERVERLEERVKEQLKVAQDRVKEVEEVKEQLKVAQDRGNQLEEQLKRAQDRLKEVDLVPVKIEGRLEEVEPETQNQTQKEIPNKARMVTVSDITVDPNPVVDVILSPVRPMARHPCTIRPPTFFPPTFSIQTPKLRNEMEMAPEPPIPSTSRYVRDETPVAVPQLPSPSPPQKFRACRLCRNHNEIVRSHRRVMCQYNGCPCGPCAKILTKESAGRSAKGLNMTMAANYSIMDETLLSQRLLAFEQQTLSHFAPAPGFMQLRQ